MTATRVIDDHIELANIGTKTHAEIEGHIQGIGNYAFPAADGTANQILKSNGAGVLSWIDPPAGFACGSLNACNLTDIGTRPHSQLTNIGASDHHVKYTDAEVGAIVATHTAIDNAHHTPYTDAEAVAACDASNNFVERSVENTVTGATTLKKTATGALMHFHTAVGMQFVMSTSMYSTVESTTHTYNQMLCSVQFPAVNAKGTDTQKTIGILQVVKVPDQNASYWMMGVQNTTPATQIVLEVHHNKIDIKNLPIKNPKNHAHSALSGTKRLVEVLIGSTPHYIEASPIKA